MDAAPTIQGPPFGASRPIHSVVVRIAHWVNAFAIVCMMMSGWAIYNASPLLDFTFPRWATLGGWLGGALAWHFAAMWLFVTNGLIYFLYGFASGHFRMDFFPIRAKAVIQDLGLAFTLRLRHKLGVYNSVQRLAYVSVLLLGIAAVISGLSLWKPIQFDWLSEAIGGYELSRRVHFAAMAGIALFIVLHLILVAIVPRTLPPMVRDVSSVRELPL